MRHRLGLPAVDWEMFRSEGLAKALTNAGHGVSARTVDRWKAGESTPSKGHLQAIRELVGAQQNAPAGAGAAEELLRLWLGRKAPPWAQANVRRILTAIAEERTAVVDAAIERAVEIAEQRLFRDNGDGDDQPPLGPPSTPGGPQPKPGSSSG